MRRINEASRDLWGVVLAGGAARRMGRDKGTMRYGGEPQALRAWRMLAGLCSEAYVSVRRDQVAMPEYAGLPLLLDEDPGPGGPAAGLLAAWARNADIGWLVLATDLPLIDESVLQTLIAQRAPDKLATAFRHADGTPEPLCTIWEPAAREVLTAGIAAGDTSLRRVLHDERIRLLEAADAARLVSVNRPEEYRRVRAQLESQGRD